MAVKLFTITIDGKQYSVDGEGKNLLAVCLSLGFNLPYFCWHPAMHSVGACRQCAVKLYRDEKDTQGRIVMSCMTHVTDGMRISVEDPEAREFRSGVIEWLMVNHPHDCPICDEGGECHLQDMTVMTGHVYRRYRFTKRTHRNEDLGPFLNHEMNRCIQCYRCVRFYRDYAGGRDLEVMGWHDNVYFGRHADGVLENEFSGNLAEVCPTGVFTDKTLKAHYTRKWDLQTAPSICVHCGVGCNTSPGERYGTLRRIRPRYNDAVNRYFLCDRGRYGYEFVNAPARIRQPMTRRGGGLAACTAEEAIAVASSLLKSGRLIGIGSARASLESNFALRQLVGADGFFLGMTDSELSLLHLIASVLRDTPAPSASVKDAEQSDAVLVLGEDCWSTAPILALALRQAAHNLPFTRAMRAKRIARWEDAALREAIQDEKGPLFVLSPEPTGLDSSALEAHRAAPQDIARIGHAVAHRIDSEAPDAPGLPPGWTSLADRIARALLVAERPLVVSGSSLQSPELVRAAANLARALKVVGREARLSLVSPYPNSLGVSLLASRGLDAAERELSERPGLSLIVMECDLAREVGHTAANRIMAMTGHLICLDHSSSPTTDRAEVLLPAGAFAESSGTLVNFEGRAQRFFSVYSPQAFPPPSPIRESWRWLGELAVAAGRRRRAWTRLDEIVAEVAGAAPELRPVREAAPNADFRQGGQRIPRMPHRQSGRTAETANVGVREPPPPPDRDSPLSFSMEGSLAQPPSALVPRFWAPGWNSDQSINKFQMEVGGPLRGGDPGVRLFEPEEDGDAGYYAEIPRPFTPGQELFLILPRHHTFGSEELSARSRAVASRAPGPYLALAAADAERLGLAEGEAAELDLQDDPAHPRPGPLVLPVVLGELPPGVASVPAGLPTAPGLLGARLPAFGRVRRRAP